MEANDRPMRSRQPSQSTDGPTRSTAQDDQPPGSVLGQPMTLDEIRESYAQRAGWIDRFRRLDQLVTGRYRRRRFGDATGRVLDVACGTGENFRYLPATADVVGVDISEDMLGYARDELDRFDGDGTLRQMDAQALEFPADSFDTVISSFSTCTFPDPVAALQEMERVCTPDGRILLVEHGESSVGPIARLQRWRAEAHYHKMGCRSTQEPLEVVSRAGLPIRDARTGLLGIITSIEAAPR